MDVPKIVFTGTKDNIEKAGEYFENICSDIGP